MADNKIQLSLSARYDGADSFKQLNADLKKSQQASADFTGSLRKGLTQVAGAFSGELSGAIRSATGILEQFTTGGIYGMMGAVATLAVNGLVKWFAEASEAAEKHRQQVRAMREGYHALLDSQVAAMEAMEQGRLDDVADRANRAVAAINALEASYRALAAAEDSAMSSGGDLKIAQINDEFSRKMAEACDELQPVLAAERNLAVALQRQESARQRQTRAVEREQAELDALAAKIQKQQEARDAELTAGRSTEKADLALAALKQQLAAQTIKVKNAQNAAEISELQNAAAVREASKSAEKAAAAYDKVVAANREEVDAVNAKAYLETQMTKILGVCAKNQVEANSYVELFSQCMKDGMSETQAYAELQKKLNDELKKRADEEGKAAESLKSGKDSPREASASAMVHIDPMEVGSGVAEWDNKTTYSKMRAQMSKDASEARQEMKRANTELLPFITYLKGNMPADMASAYADALAKDFSRDQLEQMYRSALSKQLLSTDEQRQQMQTFKNILKCLEKQGLK